MKRKQNKGFTLAELLIVVAIIAVLVAISIPIFTSQLEKSRRAVDVDNCRTLRSALATSMIDGTIQITDPGTAIVLMLYNYQKSTSGNRVGLSPYLDGGVYQLSASNNGLQPADRTKVSINGSTNKMDIGTMWKAVAKQAGLDKSALKEMQKKVNNSFCGVIIFSSGASYYIEGTDIKNPTFYSWDDINTPLSTITP